MSVKITVEIPWDVASAIRDINYDLERIDGDVEFTLAQITNNIIQAVKAIPQDSVPRPLSGFSLTSQNTTRTSSSSPTGCSSEWLGTRSCSAVSTNSAASAESSTSSALGLYIFPDFDLFIENEYGYSHGTQATGDTTIADLEAMLGPVCGFESTWQSLTWHGYRVNQPHATLFMYGIDRYPYLEIRRRSPPGFDQPTLLMLKEPQPPSRALLVSPPLPPR